MNLKSLKKYTYLFLLVPIIFFIISWVKLRFSITLVLFLFVALSKIIKEEESKEIVITRKNLCIVFLLVLLICAWGGLGGFFFQSSDWHCRNAIFRDLIKFRWPVFYENINASLTYYIGIWIVPALIGKIFFIIFGEMIAWKIANIVLLIWCAFGVTLSIIWIIKLLNVKSIKKILLVLILFLGFSGLDFIGTLVNIRFNPAKVNPSLAKNISYVDEIDEEEPTEIVMDKKTIDNYHLERWAYFFQFSSMITQIFWVFNQSIVPWLIVIVFINEKRVNKYLLLILTCIAYGPLPFIGLIPLMFVRGIKLLLISIKANKIKEFFKDVFSLENLIALISIFPIYYFYYFYNSAISELTGRGFRIVSEVLNWEGIKLFIKFYLLEIGVYWLILGKDNRNNEVLITAFVSLIFIPLLAIGLAYDFAMRVSIPAIVVINFYFIKWILNQFEKNNISKLLDFFDARKWNFKLTCAVIIFCIGLFTPAIEFHRGILAFQNKVELISDDTGSLSNYKAEDNLNFVCINPKENSFFFKYLAK